MSTAEHSRTYRDRKKRGAIVLSPIEVDATIPAELVKARWLKRSAMNDLHAVRDALLRVARHELARRAAAKRD